MTSSETSIEQGFRPWHFFVMGSLVAATAAVVMSGHPGPAHLILISVTIATAGLAGFGCYRMVAPLALAEARPSAESLGARARAGLEREKLLVLRSIKELEFDRAMGKMSESDFEDMASRLRARAIALMRQLDEAGGGGYRPLIERELTARLVRAGMTGAGTAVAAGPAAPSPVPEAPVSPAPVPVEPVAGGGERAACPACGASVATDARFCKQCGQALPAVCAGCETVNDADAKFCKQCGRPLAS